MTPQATRPTTYYLVSETNPGIRILAGTTEQAARFRLMHAQHNDRFARYYITTDEN